MKQKILTIFLFGLLSFNLLACIDSGSDNDTKSEVTENVIEDPSASNENPDAKTGETDVSELQTDATVAEDESPAEETAETLYNIGDSASLKDWTINVTDAQIVDSISSDYAVFSPNEEGNKYVQVYATAENNGKQAGNFLPSYGFGDDINAKVLYSDGYEFSATILLGYDNDLHDSHINPLSSQSGEIAFEIPSTVAESTDELLIQFSSGNDVIKFKIR